jgi:uncharacterized damage-inducible protein DinB
MDDNPGHCISRIAVVEETLLATMATFFVHSALRRTTYGRAPFDRTKLLPNCEDISLLAHYNESMNRKLYDAAAKLPLEELSADRRAFFGSILGTMNHLIAGDTIWLMRFALHPSRFRALDHLRGAPIPGNLAQSYGDSLPELHRHRTRLDGIISAMAEEVSQSDLEQMLVYSNSRGLRFQKRFGSLLLHFFNHQTHHRGQASTLLTQAGVDIGVTDLLALIPDAEGS